MANQLIIQASEYIKSVMNWLEKTRIIKFIIRLWDEALIRLANYHGTGRDEALTRVFGAYRLLICLPLVTAYLLSIKNFTPLGSALVLGLLISYFFYSTVLLFLPFSIYNSPKNRVLRIGVDIAAISLLLLAFRAQSDIFFLYGIPIFVAYIYFPRRFSWAIWLVCSACYAGVILLPISWPTEKPQWTMLLQLWGKRSFIIMLIPIIMNYQNRRKAFGQRFSTIRPERKGLLEKLPWLLPDIHIPDILAFRSQALEFMMDITANALGNPTLGFFAYDKNTNRLILVSARGYDERAIGKAFYSIGQGVTGWIAQDRIREKRIANLFDDPHFKGTHRTFIRPYARSAEDLKKRHQSISFIGVCLAAGNELIGVLTASRQSPDEQGKAKEGFSAQDLKILRLLGDQIENCYETPDYLNRLQSLTNIMHDLNENVSLDNIYDIIYNKILGVAKKVLPITGCAILKANDDGKRLIVIDSKCNDLKIKDTCLHRGRIVENGSFSWKAWDAGKEREFEYATDGQNLDPVKLETADALGARYQLVIPLSPPEVPRYGVISLSSRDQLSIFDRYFARLLAEIISVALGLARKRIEEIQLFSETSENMIKTVSVQDICDIALDTACKLSGCWNGEILRLDPTHGDLVTVAATGYLDTGMKKHIAVCERKGLVRKAALKGTLFVSPCVQKNDDYMPSFPGINTQSQMCIPLYGRNERKVIGVLNLEHEKEDYFTEDHQQLIELLGKYVSPIIYSAMRHEQFHGFYQLSKDLARIQDKLELLDKFIKTIPSILDVPICGIFLWQEDKGKYVLQRALGYPQGKVGCEGYLKGEGRTGKAIADGKPVIESWITSGGKFFDDHRKELEQKSPAALAYMAIPILDRNSQAIGVIGFARPRYTQEDSNAFTEDDRILAELLADDFSAMMEKLGSVEAEKYDLLTQIARAAAHEIHNPLWASLPDAVEVQKSIALTDPRHASLENVIRAMERVESVIQDFKDLTADRPLKYEALDIYEIVNDSLTLLKARLNRAGIAIRLDGARSVPLVNADIDSIQKVIIHLLRNAIDAAPEQGGLVKISICCLSEQKMLQIIIEDNGKGIPPQVMDKIRKPLFTTKGGINMGMGLTISDSLIRKHGGRLEIESTEGKGTKVTIDLPTGEK